jgi:hypothetical protein
MYQVISLIRAAFVVSQRVRFETSWICHDHVIARFAYPRPTVVRRASSQQPSPPLQHPKPPGLPLSIVHPHFAPPQNLHNLHNMSAEEEQYDESTMSAPGAPTPVAALEVRVQQHRGCVEL